MELPLDFATLRLIWWGLVGILLIAFALTDGFDLGVGALLPFVAKTDEERRMVINTVGATWEGNQVWFILGGGAIFAAWPFVYAVSFSGNSVTSRDQVEMSLLLRSAELTVENGYDWFATVTRATDRDTRFYTTPDPFYYDRYGPYWGPSWRFYQRGYWSTWDPYWGRERDIRQVDRYEATAEIVMGRGPKPAGDPNAFDAREVINNLGPRVMRPTY